MVEDSCDKVQHSAMASNGLFLYGFLKLKKLCAFSLSLQKGVEACNQQS
jgi:hypothetical protein